MKQWSGDGLFLQHQPGSNLHLAAHAERVDTLVAACLAGMGRLEEAAPPYESALRLAPGDPRPPYALAKALLIANRRAEAAQRFREALRLNPDHLQTLVYLSRLRASAPEPELRNGPEAIELAERAKAIAGDQEPFLLDTLAMAYAEAGRYPEAIGFLKQAIEHCRTSGDSERMKEFETRLRLYETGKPFREGSGKKDGSLP